MRMFPVKTVLSRVAHYAALLSQLTGTVLIALVKLYRYVISPLFPPSCRYVPTCSQYAIEAIRKYGAVRGGAMALWRILRCHPFSRGGYDPVR